MLQIIAYLVLLVVVGAIAWVIWHGRAEFVVRIRDGRPERFRGPVGKEFLRDLEEICRREEIPAGTIRGKRDGGRVVLQFSRQIPQPCQQQIRNAWQASG